MNEAKVRQFVEAVRFMRLLQKKYFVNRSPLVLREACAAERRVDGLLDELPPGQQGELFTPPKEPQCHPSTKQ